MSLNKIDCVFLVVSSSKKTYQNLSETYSAIEPPTWALLLAQSTRSTGFKINILDANAENLNHENILLRIKNLNPKLSDDCLKKFKSNNFLGLLILINILIGKLI